MDQDFLTRFLLNVLLLVSAYITSLHGNPPPGLPTLHCVNDYLYTINCTLSKAAWALNSSSNSSYWLTLRETFEEKLFVCLLRPNESEDYFCTVNTFDQTPEDDQPEIFMELDKYQISLCHNRTDGTDGTDVCRVLDDSYKPSANIKPNAPCCLTVEHNSTQHRFTWKSTYEEYDYSFRYQLQVDNSGPQHRHDKMMPRNIYTYAGHFSVGEEMFVPVTEYTARVRSIPTMPKCEGEWSDWSPTVHWKTDPVTTDLLFIPELLQKSLVPFVTLLIILILVYVAVRKKWTLIPTPEPYLDVMYSDCHGDFKSWVTTHEITETLTVETSAHIDSLTKCLAVPPEDCHPQVDHQVLDGRAYCNIPASSCESSLLVLPCAVNTMNPPSATETQTLSSDQTECPPEGDSNNWQFSDLSPEKGSPWYCNEYCILNTYKADQHWVASTNSC